MGRADYYAEGDWNAECGFCGRKRKASSLELNWQGLWVCPEHNPPRQPQDFVQGLPDDQSPPWNQPPGDDVFVRFCMPNGRTAIPGFAIPDCAIPDYIDPAFDASVTS